MPWTEIRFNEKPGVEEHGEKMISGKRMKRKQLNETGLEHGVKALSRGVA